MRSLAAGWGGWLLHWPAHRSPLCRPPPHPARLRRGGCRCDEQILPAVYAWVGASFQATPTQLGVVTLARAIAQALSSPLGGIAGHFAPRGHVIAAGCCIWALMTACFALTTSLTLATCICAVNGIGGCAGPCRI